MDDKKELYRLNISRHDIKQALDFLQAATKHDSSSTEYEGLIVSAIIFYARPFSNNEKNPAANALSRVPESVIEGFLPNDLVLHKRLIDRRNKAIAHAEWNEFPTIVDEETKALSITRYSIFPEFLDPLPLIALVRTLMTRLDNMVADRVSKMP